MQLGTSRRHYKKAMWGVVDGREINDFGGWWYRKNMKTGQKRPKCHGELDGDVRFVSK